MNTDGTQQVGIAGEFDGAQNDQGQGKPGDALFSVKEMSPNVMIGIVTARDRTIHSGALVKIDARNTSDPTCMDAAQYANGGTVGHACLNDENVHYTVLMPNVPTGSDPSPVGRYREPNVLPDGRIITSFAEGPVNDMNEQSLTPPDFGIYIFDPTTGQNQLVYNDRTTWDLNAVPVVARTEPPVIGNNQHQQDSTIPIHLGSVNVAQTDLNEVVSGAQFNNLPIGQALQQGAVAVRVIEGFSSESAMGVSMFGLTMFEGAAVLGEAPVFPDGSWLVTAPAYIPLHLQPIDKYGLAIRNQRLWINAMPGEDRRCVGCHESRTGQGVPALGAQPTRAEGATAAHRRTSPRPSSIAPSSRGTRRCSPSSTRTARAATTPRRPRTITCRAPTPSPACRRPTRSRASTSRARRSPSTTTAWSRRIRPPTCPSSTRRRSA